MPLVIEQDIEKRLRQRVLELGGKCIKYTASAENGIPDRIVILPKGRVAFVELKRPKGGKLSPIQKYQLSKFSELGVTARVVKNYDEIEHLLMDLMGPDYKTKGGGDK